PTARSTSSWPARSRTRAAAQAERALLSGGLQLRLRGVSASTALVRKYRVRATVGALRMGSSSSPVSTPKHHGEGRGGRAGSARDWTSPARGPPIRYGETPRGRKLRRTSPAALRAQPPGLHA